MLVGVMCEVVRTVTVNERDRSTIQALKETIVAELLLFDNDGNMHISKDELTLVMNDTNVNAVLESLDVDKDQLMCMQSALFPDKQTEVPVDRVMELIVLCRRNLPVTFAHVSELAFTTRFILSKFVQDQVEFAMTDIKRDRVRLLKEVTVHAGSVRTL